MDQRQADNTLTLIDLLENETDDVEWNFDNTRSDPIGYARENIHLFDGCGCDQKKRSCPESLFCDKVCAILWGEVFKGPLVNVKKSEVIRRLKRVVSDEGWELA